MTNLDIKRLYTPYEDTFYQLGLRHHSFRCVDRDSTLDNLPFSLHSLDFPTTPWFDEFSKALGVDSIRVRFCLLRQLLSTPSAQLYCDVGPVYISPQRGDFKGVTIYQLDLGQEVVCFSSHLSPFGATTFLLSSGELIFYTPINQWRTSLDGSICLLESSPPDLFPYFSSSQDSMVDDFGLLPFDLFLRDLKNKIFTDSSLWKCHHVVPLMPLQKQKISYPLKAPTFGIPYHWSLSLSEENIWKISILNGDNEQSAHLLTDLFRSRGKTSKTTPLFQSLPLWWSKLLKAQYFWDQGFLEDAFHHAQVGLALCPSAHKIQWVWDYWQWSQCERRDALFIYHQISKKSHSSPQSLHLLKTLMEIGQDLSLTVKPSQIEDSWVWDWINSYKDLPKKDQSKIKNLIQARWDEASVVLPSLKINAT